MPTADLMVLCICTMHMCICTMHMCMRTLAAPIGGCLHQRQRRRHKHHRARAPQLHVFNIQMPPSGINPSPLWRALLSATCPSTKPLERPASTSARRRKPLAALTAPPSGPAGCWEIHTSTRIRPGPRHGGYAQEAQWGSFSAVTGPGNAPTEELIRSRAVRARLQSEYHELVS